MRGEYLRVALVIVYSCLIIGAYSHLRINETTLKELLSPTEWSIILGHPNTDSEYALTYPILTKIEGQPRQTLWNNVTHHLLVDSAIFRGNFTLTPIPTARLLSPNFVYLETFGNETYVIPHHQVDLKCFYRSATTALNLCKGVHGLLHSNDNEYFTIHPLPKRFYSNTTLPHIVIRKPVHNMNKNVKREKYSTFDNYDYKYSKRKRKKNNGEKLNITLPEMNTKESYLLNKKKIESSKRFKRDTFPAGSPVFVETAVFVDRDLFDHMKTNFPSDTENELIRFVLAMINAVELLYHDPSLGRPVNFLLKRLEILKEEAAGLTRSPDIDRYLSNFCSWQRTKNPVGDREPQHWDHALILTGLDLYVRGKHGKISSQVVGLAPVAGMCTLTSSCTVNEGRHFESVYVVAHEIGHNLGMRHDGPMADNDCDPTSYIMSPTLGSGKITWSSCSRRYLEKFLETGQSRCLLDHGSSAGQLDHSAEGDLPGERFDANQQCMLKYGGGSRHSSQQPLDDVCRDLHCERERYTWTSHPALEGTSCGHNLWCRGGRCITKTASISASYRESQLSSARLESINGGWSKWKSFNDCASGCLYGEEGRLRTGSAGIMVAARLCNNPRPQGSGIKCEGHDKKYQTCNAKQCLNVPKLTIREFAEQICTRAKEVDKDLTGVGSQRTSTDHDEACMVWCQTRNGGTKSRGWTFPDGTACQIKRNRYAKTSYCINGRCQEFHCDIYGEEQFVLQTELCPTNKEDNEIIWRTGIRRKDYGVQWVSASGCHFNCISPGSGIRLVVRKNKKGRSSIQLCHPDQYGCGRIKSPFQHASIVCTKYREKVSRLSGLGMQISPAVEDPDRPCRVACQDENIPHRFYLVNGEDGWFPFGTDCAKGSANKKSYCISGKCLEFGFDDTPMSQTEFTLPLLSRNKRSLHGNSTRITATLHQQELDEIVNKLNATISGQHIINGSNEYNIDLSNPIHVNMDMDMDKISPHNYYKSEQDDYYNYA